MIKRIVNRKSFIVFLICAFLFISFIIFINSNNFLNSEVDKKDGNSFNLNDYNFSVSFIDVNQGDCELIICEDTVVLIDGGEQEAAGNVLTYLHENDIDEIDYYILSHPHADHIGASATIIDSVMCKNVVMTEFSENNVPDSAAFKNMRNACKNNSCQILFAESGDVIREDGLELKFYAPFTESDDYNDMSLVFTASYSQSTVLFTGDTGMSVEKEILENYPDISADVIKIAHHGSSTSTCKEFIDLVSPDHAVISCGADNQYGHPHKEIIALLSEMQIDYKRTDYCGTIVYYGDGINMTFSEYDDEIDN